jgi:hypothetical protein
MKTRFAAVAFVIAAGSASAGAQTAEDMRISISAYLTRPTGAEEPAGISFVDTSLTEKTSGGGRFSVRKCGALSLEAGMEGAFEDGSTTGWRVELTPVRVAEGAVTFRLRWIRALDTTKDMQSKSEDIELTMRPGESRPMDSVAIPVDKETGRRCPVWDNRGKQAEYSAVALRVSVDNLLWDTSERRLMAADLWLIERAATGDGRTQSLSVRGLPHRKIPFFFDAITENAVSLDIHGFVVARPEPDAISIELETNSRWGPAAFDWQKDEYVPLRRIESRLRVKPGETVEVALPQLESSAAPFTARKYAIRIRVRQLR